MQCCVRIWRTALEAYMHRRQIHMKTDTACSCNYPKQWLCIGEPHVTIKPQNIGARTACIWFQHCCNVFHRLARQLQLQRTAWICFWRQQARGTAPAPWQGILGRPRRLVESHGFGWRESSMLACVAYTWLMLYKLHLWLCTLRNKEWHHRNTSSNHLCCVPICVFFEVFCVSSWGFG